MNNVERLKVLNRRILISTIAVVAICSGALVYAVLISVGLA